MDWAAMRIEVLAMRTEQRTVQTEEIVIGAHPVSNKGSYRHTE